MSKLSLFLRKILNFDWVLIVVILLLNGLGLFSLFSQSRMAIPYAYFLRQLIFSLIGIFLMFLFALIDWRFLKDNSYLVLFFYLFSLLLLAGVLIFGAKIRGVKIWYRLGPFSFNPTELTKLALIILLAKYFSQRHVEMYRFYHILISGIYLALPIILIYLQPDLGSILVLLTIWLGILIVSGIRINHFLILLLIFLLLTIFAWNFFLKEYQKERIISFLFPNYKPLHTGWSQRQAKIALGNGGLFGKGFGRGSQTQYGFLPEPHTDFIFSAIGEEFGFLAISFMLFLYLLLFWRIFRTAIRAENNFIALFSIGLAFWILAQIFIHIGSNTGLLPIIGLSLPFISYGGSSLLILYSAIGILLSFGLYARNVKI